LCGCLCGDGRFARPAKQSKAEVEKVMNRNRKFAGWTIALGAALGAVLGAMAGNLGVWLAVGVAIGVALGASFRPKQPECPQCAATHRSHEKGME
jgi:hypothetical protein